MDQRPTEAASDEMLEVWEAPAATEYRVADVTEGGFTGIGGDNGIYS